MADAQLRLEDDAKPAALRNTEDFQQLVAEHHELDERIRHLSTLSYLSDQQQFEETQLKKRKLALKDRIESLLRGGQPRSAAPGPSPDRRCRGQTPALGACPLARSDPARGGPFVKIDSAGFPFVATCRDSAGRGGLVRRVWLAVALRCCPSASPSSFAIPSGIARRPRDRCSSPPTARVMFAGARAPRRGAAGRDGSKSPSSCPCSTCTSIARRSRAA